MGTSMRSAYNSCNGGSSCRAAQIDSARSSCNGIISCEDANIGSAVSSCTDSRSCLSAQIGSAVSSCKDDSSCDNALFIGVDLINSCNTYVACDNANGDGAFNELVDCCIDNDYQCFGGEQGLTGNEIVAAGGPTCVSYEGCVIMW